MTRDHSPFVLSALRETRAARTAVGVGALVLLAACGKVQNLQPAAGKALPEKPATAASQPQPADLLAVPTQSRPGRSDELLNRSSLRPDDKFDLPPH